MLTSPKTPATRRPVLRHPHASPGPVRRRPNRRWRRVATLAAVLCLVPAIASYVNMLSRPSDSSLSIRTVEWLRDNGARGLVNRVETLYYALTAPATGGPGLKTLPHQAAVATSIRPPAHHQHHYYRPHRLRPVIHPALRGEGMWQPTFSG